MKKQWIISAILILSLFFGLSQVAAEEPVNPWPVLELEGMKVSLRPLDEEGRHQAYFGPDNSYSGAGAYKPAKVISARALFQEGQYILVDMDYRTAGRRCVYFRYSSLNKANSIEMLNPEAYPAVTTTFLMPLLGPGNDYSTVVQTTPSKYEGLSLAELASLFGGSYEIMEALKAERNTIVLDQGTDVSVFFETSNGWVFAEFSCDLGRIRAWLPAEFISAK